MIRLLDILVSSMIYSLDWAFVMTDYRILNLVVTMTTHSLSSRYGILALKVLTLHVVALPLRASLAELW